MQNGHHIERKKLETPKQKKKPKNEKLKTNSLMTGIHVRVAKTESGSSGRYNSLTVLTTLANDSFSFLVSSATCGGSQAL